MLAALHGPDIDVVAGGVTGRNVLIRPGPTPAVHLRVATSVHAASGSPVTDHLGAEWRRPDVAQRSDRQRDCYSLALFVARTLAPGPFSSVSVHPEAVAEPLGSAGAELLARALSTRDATPSALAWLRVLSVRCGRAIEPPRVTSVELARSLVAAGEPLDVRWTATQATSIEIAAPGAEPVRVAVRDGEGVAAAHPTRTGRIAVRAHNDHGSHERASGPVGVFDIASVVRVALPEPVLPPPVPMPESRTAPGFPDIEPVPFPVIAAPEHTIGLPPLPAIAVATTTYPATLPTTTDGPEPR